MTETITIKQVFDELKKIEKNMVTKEELEAFKDTIEIISNPETMRQIADSKEDIKQGKTKIVHSVSDLLSEA